ncbi:MAG: hypothetical protein IJ033_03060 [Clostridia bacterium]|nr:hypothetical protein [Clostridia bacterium]
MQRVRLVILAKSYKQGGYCVAGLNLFNGEWIRLVSSRGHDNAISKYAMDSRSINCLDIVDVDLIEHVPLACQKENFRVYEETGIIKTGKLGLEDVVNEMNLDKPNYIFANSDKYIFARDVKELNRSLLFVKVSNFQVTTKSNFETDKPKFKCSFCYNNTYYVNLSLTDPNFCSLDKVGKVLRSAALVISLPSKAYEDGAFYKFVSSVFPLEEMDGISSKASEYIPTCKIYHVLTPDGEETFYHSSFNIDKFDSLGYTKISDEHLFYQVVSDKAIGDIFYINKEKFEVVSISVEEIF